MVYIIKEYSLSGIPVLQTGEGGIMKTQCIYPVHVEKALEKRRTSMVGGSLILSGEKGLGKAIAGMELAAALLGCNPEKLMIHPDFKLIAIEPKESCIKIDQVREISRFISLVPVQGMVKVVLIDDADTMTESAQNALLKSLEDGTRNTLFILVCHGKVLPTIRSRSSEIRFPVMTYVQVSSIFNNLDDVALRLCGGRPGFYSYLVEYGQSFLKEVGQILKDMETMENRRQMLPLFHCLKEKDKDIFFEKYDRTLVIAFLQMLKDVYTSALLYQQCGVGNDDLSIHLSSLYGSEELIGLCSRLSNDMLQMRRNGSYNKNDFFDLIRVMIG